MSVIGHFIELSVIRFLIPSDDHAIDDPSSSHDYSSGCHSSEIDHSIDSPLTDNDLHTSLLQPSPESPSALAHRLWKATHFLYYLLPRFLLQFTLLPLLHNHDKLALQRFLTRLPQSLSAVSPPDTLLFALTHLLHCLTQCLSSSSPLSNPLSFLDGDKSITERLAANLPLSSESVADFACELLGDWLQLPSLGVCCQRSQPTLLCFHFLVTCVFPFANAQVIAKTLLKASMSGVDLMIMEVCVRGLSRDFFSTHYREVLRFVSKTVQSTVAPIGEKTHGDSL